MNMPRTHRLELFDRIDSTNLEAMRRIRAGERGPLWLRAQEQTAGKGRSGRGWTSEPGNFYGSLILPLTCNVAVAQQLSLIAGVAVVDALNDVAGAPIQGLRLKWPNDLLIGNAKLAGILLESSSAPTSGELIAVLGIGINLANPPANLDRPVAGLQPNTKIINPEALVAPISHWLDHWLCLWSDGANFREVRTAWQNRAGPLGEAMQVNTGTGPIAGRYNGLDDDGALLLLRASGDTSRFTYGDVTLAAGTTSAAPGRA
jgi:BirA family transcriptional regulator, biotin operon repressor / biotin---[acetyl-CoA-carboxylase] ligase